MLKEKVATATRSELVKFERVGEVAVLTMSFAPHNLLGEGLSRALMAALSRATEEKCRAVVLRSSLRHFSTGADLALFEDRGARFQQALKPLDLLREFEEHPLPIVASVHGVALGGGFELALACDIIVAASSSKFGLVEVTLGLHPLMGGIQRVMQRVGAARAKEMVMLGRRHDAATLERWGIVNRVVPDAQLNELSMAVAQELALGPTIAHGCTKRLVNMYLNEGMAKADTAMAEITKPIWKSDDLQSGLKSYSEKGLGQAIFTGK